MSETINTCIAQGFSLSTSYPILVGDQDSSASTTIAVAPTLPQAVIRVVSTAGFPASGTIFAGGQVVTYTSVTGGGTPSFNGCAGGTGLMAIGTAVIAARTVTFNPSGTVWYRPYLCAPSGTGADDENPKEWLFYCESALNTLSWRVRMRSNGKARATYLGIGTGSIAWAGTVIGTTLGFTSNVVALATNGTQDAANSPTHTIMSHWREAPLGWQGTAVGDCISELDNGKVDYLGGTYQKMTRSFSLRGHPYTPTDATALPMPNATPMYSDEAYATLWKNPVLAPAVTAIPWTIHQFMATSKGIELGYTLGEFQDLVSGAQAYFDEGYWTKKVLESTVGITSPNWRALNDRTNLELTKTSRPTIT